MSTRVEQAVGRFVEGFNCSQAVLGSYCEEFGLDCEMGFKVATGFGGGMHIGKTCGAVTGAFMVLGLKYGSTDAEDEGLKAKAYEKIMEYSNRFKDRNGSVECRELLGCDISEPEGIKKAVEEGLFGSVCPKMVRDAAEILEEMLGEEAMG